MIIARVGDVVKVNVSQPQPMTHILTLLTPKAAAYATKLLNDPANSGWWLEPADSAGDVRP
jgi:hypothetical protein